VKSAICGGTAVRLFVAAKWVMLLSVMRSTNMRSLSTQGYQSVNDSSAYGLYR
jgi:hypothetical protein